MIMTKIEIEQCIKKKTNITSWIRCYLIGKCLKKKHCNSNSNDNNNSNNAYTNRKKKELNAMEKEFNMLFALLPDDQNDNKILQIEHEDKSEQSPHLLSAAPPAASPIIDHTASNTNTNVNTNKNNNNNIIIDNNVVPSNEQEKARNDNDNGSINANACNKNEVQIDPSTTTAAALALKSILPTMTTTTEKTANEEIKILDVSIF
ncbi:myb domain-containing protein [Reticulomyxa filosa]|uniref:Myb domain-containing protein n=1 Tax=Reticulomyxa filosa TaxID=46433 RepID=X6LW98_RETFI|nr:myb domain-containing protein [Reticulomyxa filosa]|eukprot:ETO06223.1 myb domain-containing protein [Reticulomyxa filosa]